MTGTPSSQLEFVINDLSRRITRLYNHVYDDAGVSHLQAKTLIFLDHEGVQTQTELANRMEMARAAMGALLDRMEAAGLIERINSPSDRRIKLIRMTPKARPLIGKINELASKVGPRIRSGTTKSERKAAIEVLQKIRDNIEREEKLLAGSEALDHIK